MARSPDNQQTVTEEDVNDFDVIIVGAGLTGLIAANRLILAGLSTLLIEKSGGRLLSEEYSNSYYAHESQYNIAKVITKFDLMKKTEKFPDSRELIYCQSITLGTDVPFYIVGEVHCFVKIMDDVSKNNTVDILTETINIANLSNLSVEEILHNLVFFAKSRSLCRILIYITCGIHRLESISAIWYFRMLNGAGGFLQRLRMNLGDSGRYYIKGGAMGIARLLASKVENENKIHYGEEAVRIQFSDDRAHVWSETAHYKCDYVIFAVPLTNNCQVVIEPELPTCVKQTEIERKNVFFNAVCKPPYECNSAVKNILMHGKTNENVTLIYDATCIEDEKLHFSGFSSEIELQVSALIEVINKYCDCRILEFDKFNTSTESLMNVFKPKDWENNCLALQNHGRIIFAGSEFATQWPGTMDGAIESGEFAALSILQWMRPQSVDRYEWILYKSKDKISRSKESTPQLILLHSIGFWLNFIVSASLLYTTMLSELRNL